jgi:glutathione peroxidase
MNLKNLKMKKLISISLIVLLSSATCLMGIYDFSVPKIEGGNYSLSASQGKKIMIITLPIERNAAADSMLYCLDTLAAAHNSNLTVIGVPSYEDGYTPSSKQNLLEWYRSKLDSTIVITEGLYTHKSNSQHALFKWLTDVSQNGSFDMDVEGLGHKFFINTNGELYGVLIPYSKISGESVQRTLLMQ